jgi:hypothetical protein
MNRRRFILSASASVSCVLPTAAFGRLACGPFVPPGFQECEAGIDSELAYVAAADPQHLSNWCWAASIEMVFGYYGHQVSQDQIVRDAWGGNILNLPGQPAQILGSLNRSWVDAQGRQFSVTADVSTANMVTAAQDLAQDMPLIIGTMGHCMVLTSLRYRRDQFGNGNVTLAIVRDPIPGRGRRALDPQEFFGTTLLARIRVFG